MCCFVFFLAKESIVIPQSNVLVICLKNLKNHQHESLCSPQNSVESTVKCVQNFILTVRIYVFIPQTETTHICHDILRESLKLRPLLFCCMNYREWHNSPKR